MSTPGPGERAVAAFNIDDVFMVECNATMDRSFNQTEAMPAVYVRQGIVVEQTMIVQTRTPLDQPAPPIHILRYIVVGLLEVSTEDWDKQSQQGKESHPVLAKLRIAFAADYACDLNMASDKEAVGAFARNVAFHVWPYWREAAHAFFARMRLPRVTLPMFRQEKLPKTATPEPSTM